MSFGPPRMQRPRALAAFGKASPPPQSGRKEVRGLGGRQHAPVNTGIGVGVAPQGG